MIEKQGIINLSSYSSECYVSEARREKEDAIFCQFLNYVLLIHSVT